MSFRPILILHALALKPDTIEFINVRTPPPAHFRCAHAMSLNIRVTISKMSEPHNARVRARAIRVSKPHYVRASICRMD